MLLWGAHLDSAQQKLWVHTLYKYNLQFGIYQLKNEIGKIISLFGKFLREEKKYKNLFLKDLHFSALVTCVGVVLDNKNCPKTIK